MTLMETLSAELSDLVEGTRPSLVHVHAPGAAGRTGVVLDTGDVVTVARQAEPGEEVAVLDADGSDHAAEVQAYDRTSGITILSLRGDIRPGPGLPAPPAGSARVGMITSTVAYPSPQGVEARLGILRCVGSRLRLPGGRLLSGYIQTDASGFPGFSGAPLLAADRSLLGIALPSGDGETLYMPSDDLHRIVTQLQSTPLLAIGYLGVRGQQAPLEHTACAEGQHTAFLLVSVDEASPAAAAGLQVGDMIHDIDGTPVSGVDDLMDALVGPEASRIRIRWIRGGAQHDAEVVLGTRSSRHS